MLASSTSDVRQAAEHIEQVLKSQCVQCETKTGRAKAIEQVYWHEPTGLWISEPYRTHWQPSGRTGYSLQLGLSKKAPSPQDSTGVCEANLQCDVDPKASGQMALDQEGRRYWLHTSTVGRPGGAGRFSILRHYRKQFSGKVVEVDRGGGKLASMLLIACIDSPRFLDEAAAFARAVDRIKRLDQEQRRQSQGQALARAPRPGEPEAADRTQEVTFRPIATAAGGRAEAPPERPPTDDPGGGNVTRATGQRQRSIAQELLRLGETRIGDYAWPWLDERDQLTKRDANKYFLWAIVDYQTDSDVIYPNVERFTEEVLGDPEDLWGTIAAVPESAWMRKEEGHWVWTRADGAEVPYQLHRYPQAQRRVWRIANELVGRYGGDARRIWEGQTPGTVFSRLTEIRAGENISRMIVLALKQRGLLCEGPSDPKIDTHVRRVLGRLLVGQPLSAADALAEARQLWPEDPSALDRGLWETGMELCHASEPRCADCTLQPDCAYASRR